MNGLSGSARTHRPRRKIVASLVVAAIVLVGGAAAIGLSTADASGANTSASASPPSAADTDTGAAGSVQDPVARTSSDARSAATAVRVQIPAIGVDSSLEQLPLDAAGSLTPPADFDLAGWYRDGTVPGDVGPAVIAGHVDSVTAPAVFARLGELKSGDQIMVTLSTGDTKVFAVDSMQSAPKNAFPTEQVYGPTPTAQLRVITCDGDFNSSTGHYLDNLIVSASLVG